MVNKQKRKGSDWEKQLVSILNRKLEKASAKRIPGSGAIGTIMGEPLLTSDVKLVVESFPKAFKIESKVGYGGVTQLTIKREWLDKVRQEAIASYSVPLLACKFSGARESDGVQFFVAMDIDTFCDIINYITNLKEQLDKT